MFLAPDGKEIPAFTELITSREISHARVHTHTRTPIRERRQNTTVQGPKPGEQMLLGWRWRPLPGMSFLGRFPLIAGSKLAPEKAMAPYSSTLVWKVPWTEEPGRLQSMGSRRVGHD